MQELKPSTDQLNIQFKNDYEELRVRFNTLAEGSCIPQKIKELLQLEKDMSGFDHTPYLLHESLNTLELITIFDVGLAHTTADHAFAYNDHVQHEQLDLKRSELSHALIKTISLLGKPSSYTQALAQQSLLARLNPHYLSTEQYEEFKNIQYNITSIVSGFSTHLISAQLDSIRGENQRAFQYFSVLVQAIRQVSLNTTDIKHSIEKNDSIKQIVTQLQENGIKITAQFAQFLEQSEVTFEGVNQIINYLESIRSDKIEKQNHKLKCANYQGLLSTFQFVGQLSTVTGSHELSLAANMAQASVEIHRAVEQIISASSLSLALLNPFAAISTAVLNIFSLFRRSQSPNQILMKQLVQISKQIENLHRSVLDGFKGIDRRLISLLRLTQKCFEILHYSLTIPVTRQLSEIQYDIETLCLLTKHGFKEILMNDLKNIGGLIEDLNRGITSADKIKEGEYENYLRLLRESYIEHQPSLFTGSIYIHLLDAKSQNINQLVNLLNSSEQGIHGILYLLLYYAKSYLQCKSFDEIDQNDIFHPEIWRAAIVAYVQLRQKFSIKYPYDSKGELLKRFIDQGYNALKFINILQSNFDVYQIIFKRIVECQSLLAEKYYQLLQNSGISFNESIEEQVEHYKKQSPQNVDYQFSRINDQATKVLPKEKLILLIAKKIIPPEFILAEKLGIGHFQYIFHAEANIKFDHNRWNLKPGGLIGFEINFICDDLKIPLYQPIVSNRFADKDSHNFIKYIIENYTQPVNLAIAIINILDLIRKNIHLKKNNLAQQIAMFLTLEPAYHDLIMSNNFLVVYLRFANFPHEIVQLMQESFQCKNIIADYDNYAKNSTLVTSFPFLRICQPTVLTALQDKLRRIINIQIEKSPQPSPNSILANICFGVRYLQGAILNEGLLVCDVQNQPFLIMESYKASHTAFFREQGETIRTQSDLTINTPMNSARPNGID